MASPRSEPRRKSKRKSFATTSAKAPHVPNDEGVVDQYQGSDHKEDAAAVAPVEENNDQDADAIGIIMIGSPPSQRQQRQKQRKERLMREFDTLNKEMEVATYAKTQNGQFRRTVPKAQSKSRTKKRRLLEQEDRAMMAVYADDSESERDQDDDDDGEEKKRSTRLRGSRVSLDEDVVQASAIFPADMAEKKAKSTISRSEQVEEAALEHVPEPQEQGDNVVDLQEEIDETTTSTTTPASDPAATRGKKRGKYKPKLKVGPVAGAQPKRVANKRRRFFKMKNFQSQKMAQRHGDALGAHARGQPQLAIAKLKAVARDAPSAPQVYSSLGMVYEEMLRESIRKHAAAEQYQQQQQQQQLGLPKYDGLPPEQPQEAATSAKDQSGKDANLNHTDVDVIDVDEDDNNDDSIHQEGPPYSSSKLLPPDLAEQIGLAKKAYGSYHVAAILCKKDFQLWVRAADAASEIADLHGQAMVRGAMTWNGHNNNSHTLSRLDVQDWHRSEKRRWLNEAKHDFTMADNLKPPGIDVPAKLATVHMELGNLADALTLLTDLKNTHAKAGTLREFGHKAWLLYADLMLRIGHECMQWNNGIQTNDNLMFRRWLRKWSGTFDWRERRLQALSLALEAAAGSQSCSRYLDWARRRALVQQQQEHLDTSRDDAANTIHLASKEQEATLKDALESHQEKVESPSSQAKQYAAEKQLMLDRNEKELAAFDESTKDMDLFGNKKAENERSTARNKLLEAHRGAITTLAGEFHAKEQIDALAEANDVGGADAMATKESSNDNTDEIMFEHNNLPLAASCRTVCSIASELMKHLLDLELFGGGRLAGESVSLYLRERARVYGHRADARRKLDERSQPIPLFSLQGNTYDEINDNGEVSAAEEEDFPYLSDDEQLDAADDSAVLNSLRRGLLPPETSVLFALCLAQEGGRNFVAKKCFESIDLLEQETREWLFESVVDSGLSNDSHWHVFCMPSTEPLMRTAAYSLVADILQKHAKENEWSTHFAQWFGRQIKVMEAEGLIDELLAAETAFSPASIYRRNLLLKVPLAWCRLQFVSASDKLAKALQGPVHEGEVHNTDTNKEAVEAMLVAIQAWKKLLNISGSRALFIENEGVISSLCAEIICNLGKAFAKLAREYEALLDESSFQLLLAECKEMASCLSGAVNAEGDDDEADDHVMMPDDWKQEILPSSWQSVQQKAISLRCYNLCVGANVSDFSGWKKDEFSLAAMKKTSNASYFGLRMHHDRVAGVLPSFVEDELVKQWEVISEVFPEAWSFDFIGRFKETKDQSWYQDAKYHRLEMLERDIIANNGEVGGLEIYLSYSRACLMKAKSPTLTSTECLGLLASSLSVLLPMTQFCVDQKVWDSNVGKAATQASDTEGWLKLAKTSSNSTPKAASNLVSKLASQPPPPLPPVTKRTFKPSYKSLDERFQGEKKVNHLSNAVMIPASELNRVWKTKGVISDPSDEAREAMQKVHDAMVLMRSCFSEEAVEKACVQVAVAMLDLVSENGCENPFVCLQQAAIFASHGTKRGASDAFFREGLPKASDCTPQDALVILGRADCFQAVFFPYEAAFLCSYVARVCRTHRAGAAPHPEAAPTVWNDQWKIIGIMCYNVSAMIRTTVGQVLLSETKKEEFDPWDQDVVDELMKGRADALSWKSKLSGVDLAHQQQVQVNVDPTGDPEQGNATVDRESADCVETIAENVSDTDEYQVPGELLEDFSATVGHRVSEDFTDVAQVAV